MDFSWHLDCPNALAGQNVLAVSGVGYAAYLWVGLLLLKAGSLQMNVQSLQSERDRVLALFDASSPASQYLNLQISKISDAFLHGDAVTSAVSSSVVRQRVRDTQMPEIAMFAPEYVDYIQSEIVAHSVNVACPRFIGHMTSALPAVVQDMSRLMTALNQNTVKLETAKSLTYLERQVLATMHRLVFGFSSDFYDQHVQNADSTLGMITSGGTVANIAALWCARNKALPPTSQFPGVEACGLPSALRDYGFSDAVVVGSSLMHYSLDKAVGVLGLGTESLIKIETDDRHHINLNALEAALSACKRRKQLIIAVVGIAGTTDSGAIDPLPEVAQIAHSYGAHFHVDAAWGGAALFSREYARRLEGIEQADSVTLDGHKQLYLPMGLGMLLLRDPQIALHIQKQARYIVRPGSYDLGRRSLEGSRPGMVLLLHAMLNLIGRRGYEVLIDEGIRKTHYLVRSIQARPEFELLIHPDMNIVTYRYLPSEYRSRDALEHLSDEDQQLISKTNQSLQRVQRRAGRTFVSRTTIDRGYHGRTVSVVALRAVLANPLTTEADIDAVLDDQVELGKAFEVDERTASVA